MSANAYGLTLILGGARSGKSSHAVAIATQRGAPTLFVATAKPSDAEMRDRIRRHRAERPNEWKTLEEPIAIAQRIDSEARPGMTVIVDCLTVWLANLFEERTRAVEDPTAAEVAQISQEALAEMEALCELPKRKQVAVLAISNEVGSGLVPPYPLGRAYRDLLGEVNQYVASHAENALLLIAGIPIDLRALSNRSTGHV